MKKFMTVFVLLVLCTVGTAVWFSPLAKRGAKVYRDNEVVASVDGLCYAEGECVRYDFSGSERDMYACLKDIRADVVRVTRAGGVTIVYAKSDRVCAPCGSTCGAEYNVMAAYRAGMIAVGSPVLQGSY